jgi:hypothetical protein
MTTGVIPRRSRRGGPTGWCIYLIRKPAGEAHRGHGHELCTCTWGEPTRPGVRGLSRRRYTQYVEHNWTRRLR